MEPGDKLLRSGARGDELLRSGDELRRSCGDVLRRSTSRGCSCAGAAQSTTPEMGNVATYPLPPGGVLTASEREAES